MGTRISIPTHLTQYTESLETALVNRESADYLCYMALKALCRRHFDVCQQDTKEVQEAFEALEIRERENEKVLRIMANCPKTEDLCEHERQEGAVTA